MFSVGIGYLLASWTNAVRDRRKIAGLIDDFCFTLAHQKCVLG